MTGYRFVIASNAKQSSLPFKILDCHASLAVTSSVFARPLGRGNPVELLPFTQKACNPQTLLDKLRSFIER